MTVLRTGVLLGLVIVAAVGGVSAAPAAQRRTNRATPAAAAPQKDGWWIRVNPDNTAPNLYWRFGTQGRLGGPINWTRGQNPEVFDFPAAQRQLEAVDVAALAMPANAMVSFCVFFRDEGISLFEFSQEKNLTVDRSMRAPECTP